MAWFKQTEQKSSTSPQSQALAAPAATPAATPQISAIPVDQRPALATSSPAAAPASVAPSRVGRGIVLRGEITGREDLSIDGEVEGTLHLDGAKITVGQAGRVRASVTAREIVIQGEVHGDLRAEERIEIGRSGSVHGTACAKRVAIEDGAVFNGSIEMPRTAGVSRSSEIADATRADSPAAPRPAKATPSVSAAPAEPSSAQAAWRDEAVPARDSRN